MKRAVALIGTCLIASAAMAQDVRLAPPIAAEAAARGLLQRLLPDRADRFVFEQIEADAGRDVFELESRGEKIVVRGNRGLAMAMGLNWYLKHVAHCDVSWYGNQLALADPLPQVPAKIRRVAWARYRYFLNYCCFGYSLPWWDWQQWEKLIDWMALNGVNAPLAVTGQEAAWEAVCRRLCLGDEQIEKFLAGPPFLSFGWMGCLDGWGGPLPKTWNARREELGRKILARQRQFGMTPVLQGFTGHVPPGVTEKFPAAKLQQIRWIEWETHVLDPLDPLFPRIAAMFLEEQRQRFGTDHLYAADTFIEMVPPSGEQEYLKRLSRAIYDGMAKSDPAAVWVFQGWPFFNQHAFWTPPRIRAFLDAVPNDRMLVLDLYCDSVPVWSQTEAFCGKPWAWCYVQSFGRAVHLGGAMDKMAQELPAVRRNAAAGRLAGLGFVNEGLCYNPVAYDLMFEMAWRDEPVDLARWIDGYARHRYGRADADASAAWATLKDAVYSSPAGAVSIVTRAPTLDPAGLDSRKTAQLAQTWQRLLQASDRLGSADTFRFDLVNVARQVLSNRAANLQHDIVAAHRAKDPARLAAAGGRFLGLIRDLDELLATRREFLLGANLEDAKRWGQTDTERARMEWNARRVLTTWGATAALRDYARKEWSGMLTGFYAKRWERYLAAQVQALRTGKPLDEAAIQRELVQWELAWADQRESYPAEPRGDSVAVARRLWAKYGGAFEPNAPSLTTGKPATCSHALPPFPAELANDGWNDTESYWATDVTAHPEAWWQTDLVEPTTVGRVVVVGYHGDKRSYGFTVAGSLDGKSWDMLADRRDNKELSTHEGYTCRFSPRKIRYLRVTLTGNSANTGRHLVEVMAFGE
ncbi:MAG: alpha-N-acetylglucosaminidase TIM-barrel domain-containing protein [Pirellulales bacterium]